MTAQMSLRFSGKTFNAPKDGQRLTKQYHSVFTLMRDGQWRTLAELETSLGAPQASISARLRDMRKARFGAHSVDRRRRTPEGGLFEYRLIENSHPSHPFPCS